LKRRSPAAASTPGASLLVALVVAAAPPALVAQQAREARPTLTVGDATARRGERALGTIAVPAGVDAALAIPVAVFHGSAPGPVLALVAGAHGTEYTSIVAMERLIGTLDPVSLRGSVIVVPLVNVPSFERKVAHLNPVDGKNMNRFYPGRADGTQTERAAFAIMREVVAPADGLIDLHGGDIDEALRPFMYWTATGDRHVDSVSKAMVLAFGLDHIVVSRRAAAAADGPTFLDDAALALGKPAITAEAGGHGAVLPAEVDTIVSGVLGVMAQLGMLDRPVRPVRRPVWLTTVHTVKGASGGIFHPDVRPDQHVTRGTRLGRTTDFHGREVEAVTAPADGIVLYVRPVPSMTKGETVAAIGVPGTP
jgi:predicted deacylase